MRARPLLLVAALAACNAGGTVRPTDPAVFDAAASAGLASCLGAIGRADVAADPSAPMSQGEIEALLRCTSDRAGR